MIDFSNQTPRAKREKQKTAAQVEAEAVDFSEVEFEEIELEVTKTRGSAKAGSKISDAMAVAIAFFLFIAPIPYGAHRALAWSSFAVLLAVMALFYVVAMALVDPDRPSQVRKIRSVLVPGLLFIAVAALQLVPISFGDLGGLLPETLVPNSLTLSQSATGFGILRLCSYAILFVLVTEICTNRMRTERLTKLVFWGVLVHALWSLVSLSFLDDTLLFAQKAHYEGFATGTFVNRNSFATYLGMGMVIGVAQLTYMVYAPKPRSPRRRTGSRTISMDAVVQFMLVSIIVLALVSTGSRLGLLLGIVGSVLVAIAIMVKSDVKIKVKAAFGLAAGAVLLLVLALSGSLLSDRLAFALVDAETRIELYRQTMDMIWQRPWFGYGLDSYSIAFEIFHSPELKTSLTWEMPHNTYLTLWSELGLIGGSLPLIAIAIAFWAMVRNLWLRERSFVPAACGAAVVVVVALHSFGDFSLEIAANVYLFVAIVALGMARRAHLREDK